MDRIESNRVLADKFLKFFALLLLFTRGFCNAPFGLDVLTFLGTIEQLLFLFALDTTSLHSLLHSVECVNKEAFIHTV